MKKLVSLIMITILSVMLLTACGNNNETQNNANDQEPVISDSASQDIEAENENDEAQPETEAETVDGVDEQQETADDAGAQTGRVLVVYYSASGNTKAVGDVIAQYTGGNTFEIIPVNEYTGEDLDWTQDGSRVNLEHEDESLQDIELVSTTVEDFDSYDTIFIGYPIWWQEAAWVVNNFVKDNDFTGKTVIPFCTSSSSGMGESGRKLAEMAGTGDWQEGQRFAGRAGEAEVTEWLESIGF